jgi:glycosyltransferase involved in cell wall biosynthesis
MHKKIVIVLSHLSKGGTERVFSLIANKLIQRIPVISIITLDGDKVDYPIDDRISIKHIMIKHRKSPWKSIETFFKLYKAIQSEKPDLMIDPLYPHYTIPLSILFHIKIILSLRNDPQHDKSKRYQKFRKLLYNQADSVVFQSAAPLRYFSKKVRAKSQIIPNPISPDLPERFEGRRRKEIVSVCRINEQKNIPMTIKAFAIFAKEFPDYSLSIFGDGELRDKMIGLSKEIAPGCKIAFPGFVKNIHDIIRDCAMYVSSSNYEGISNSMLEALALGIPSVITDCPAGGARLYIRNEINGILIPVGDVDALFRGMKRIVTDKEFAESISKRSISIRDELDSERIGELWFKLIQSM